MNPLPHLEHPAIPCPDNLPVSIAKKAPVILQRTQRHKPFNEKIIQLNKETVLRARKNDCVEVLANAILHELDLLPLDQLPLCIIGASLSLARLRRNRTQLRLWNRSLQRRPLNFLRTP